MTINFTHIKWMGWKRKKKVIIFAMMLKFWGLLPYIIVYSPLAFSFLEGFVQKPFRCRFLMCNLRLCFVCAKKVRDWANITILMNLLKCSAVLNVKRKHLNCSKTTKYLTIVCVLNYGMHEWHVCECVCVCVHACVCACVKQKIMTSVLVFSLLFQHIQN